MLISAVFFSLLPALAAPAASSPVRSEACSGPLHEAFDFWVGDWEVRSPDGKLAGTNIISLEEAGCLLLERWTGVGGSTGQSYNFVDPSTRLWRQVWVSSGAVIDYSGGPAGEGSMRLEGTIHYQTSGAVHPFRGTWTLSPDGSVRQHFEQADPETGAWSDWFTGIYVRREAPVPDAGSP